METKAFETPVLASISTGVLLCEFSKMHEAAEWLLGHQVWTHEFASTTTVDRLKAALIEQHPDFDIDAEGVGKDNWAPFTLDLIERLGPSREIVKGSDIRDKSPIATAVELMSPAPEAHNDR